MVLVFFRRFGVFWFFFFFFFGGGGGGGGMGRGFNSMALYPCAVPY